MRNKKPYVFEAVGQVESRPLSSSGLPMVKRANTSFAVEGGLSVEQQQKLAQTAKRYLGKPYDFSFSWSDDRQYCSGSGVEGYQKRAGNARGRTAEVKEFDLSNPLVQAKLKERYGKNIPLEETVVSPQAVFDAPQLTTVAKEWPLFW
ncbi:YiiX/YebB-like N1pC/P60 family cysteine hydrolase [Escherichia coli]